MSWNQIEGNWKQLKGNVKQKWGKLNEDELAVNAGNRKPAADKNQHTRNNKKDDVEN